jgi:hypothetical protein
MTHNKSNKIVLIIVINLFSFITIKGQVIQWETSFGGSGFEYMVGDKMIRQTPNGGYIVAGTTWGGNSGNVYGYHNTSDYWLAKVNSSGAFLWGHCYGGNGADECRGISLTSDHGFIIVGSSNSTDADVTGNHGLNDIWVVKTDSMGTIQWQKSIGGSADDTPWAICQATDNNYYILGQTNSTDGDVSGGVSRCWIIRQNTIGNIIWEKGYGSLNHDEQMHSIEATSDGGCIAGGYAVSNNGDISGNHGGGDVWVVKIDSLHSIEWQKCYGGSNQEGSLLGVIGSDQGGLSLIQTNDDGFMIGGGTSSRWLYLDGKNR